jgi:PIN domain nuclease of toxin-antitoxin system
VRLLLDTHVLIWSVTDPERLREELRHAIVDPDNDVYVSTVSLWEVLIKARVGKLTRSHLEALEVLPVHHRDPFDHLLLAQAIAEDLTFVSGDRHASAYSVKLMRC